MIAADLSARLGTDLGFVTPNDVTAAIAEHVDGYEAVTIDGLTADPNGVVAVTSSIDATNPPNVQLGDRNAYDFRLIVSRKLYDAGVNVTHSVALAPLAGSTAAYVNPLDVPRIGAAVDSEVKLTSARASIVLPLRTDPSVQRGTVWVPFNQPTGSGVIKIGDLIDASASVTDVRIETL
jgi:NADH-quinone oxidoreductase subunit G